MSYFRRKANLRKALDEGHGEKSEINESKILENKRDLGRGGGVNVEKSSGRLHNTHQVSQKKKN